MHSIAKIRVAEAAGVKSVSRLITIFLLKESSGFEYQSSLLKKLYLQKTPLMLTGGDTLRSLSGGTKTRKWLLLGSGEHRNANDPADDS